MLATWRSAPEPISSAWGQLKEAWRIAAASTRPDGCGSRRLLAVALASLRTTIAGKSDGQSGRGIVSHTATIDGIAEAELAAGFVPEKRDFIQS